MHLARRSLLGHVRTGRLYSVEKSLEKKLPACVVKTEAEVGRCLDELSAKDGVKVTLVGADSAMGQAAALSLKCSGRHVRELRLWGRKGSLRGVALDLSHIPTSVRVHAYVGRGQLDQALRDTDVVVCLAGAEGGDEAERIREVARSVTLSAPRALVGLAISPLNSILAFFAEVQRCLGSFCPERVVGLTCLEEMRTRSLLATALSLPPSAVRVSLTGGATPATLVPVLESGPGGDYLGDGAVALTSIIRSHSGHVEREAGSSGPRLAAGLAVANFVRRAAEGMCTEKRPEMCLLMRTDLFPGLSYLVLPASLGPSGVEATPGIPSLSEREFRLLISSLSQLQDDTSAGVTWAHTKKHKALSSL